MSQPSKPERPGDVVVYCGVGCIALVVMLLLAALIWPDVRSDPLTVRGVALLSWASFFLMLLGGRTNRR